jgi:hypothetical protein
MNPDLRSFLGAAQALAATFIAVAKSAGEKRALRNLKNAREALRGD